jgi:mono/diheme cytochrome c family protein
MKRVMAGVAVVYVAALVGASMGMSAPRAQSFDGRQVFRFDTFGDEQLWTSTLRMQEALATVSPATALGVGLKVDVDALPRAVIKALREGQVNLNDPAVTRQLLALNAVVGVVGRVTDTGTIQSIGVTCALCHSTVNNSLTTGIGKRLDGWANRDLNVGAIIALSPALTVEQKALFNSWGRGKFDPRLQAFNGTTFIPLNSPTLPVVIPPVYGLQRVGFETVTADGPISYWNSYVGISQMGGHGNFSDTRINLAITQPAPDLVTPKLPALLAYQLSLRSPDPPAGSFNIAAAQRGESVFSGAGRCSTCHTPPTFTDVLNGPDPAIPLLHAPSETEMEPEFASRSATLIGYRTAPLRGIWQHPPYFHDGSAPDLAAVVEHYNRVRSLGLTAAQKADLVEFLKSL